MKQLNLLRRAFIAIAMMLTVGVSSYAYDFEVGGIYYDIPYSSSSTCKTVSVTYKDYSNNDYSGDVIIPENVTYNNVNYSVTSIGDWAFSGCSSLTSVTIGNSVTSIGNSAFYDCSGLIGVVIPNSVTTIEGSTFFGCSSLTSVTIGNSVTSIGDWAFVGCSSLTSVHITDIESWCKIDFNSTFSNPLYCANNLYLNGELLTNLVIPEGITEIKNCAFSYCRCLTSVVIPEGVTSIGSDAFSYCSSLTSVVIPNRVTSIGQAAFSYCSSLTSVVIPNSVTSIGQAAFFYCSGLTSVVIPNSVTSIGNSAFYGCSGLTGVVIPNSVTTIEGSTFSGCSSLTSVTIGNGVTSIGSYAFYCCSSLTGKLELPSSITSIDEEVFNYTNYKVCKIDATKPPTICSNSLPSSLSFVLVPANSDDAYRADGQWRKYTIIAEGACDIEVTNETAGELSRSILTQTRKNLNNITSLTVHGTLNAADIEKINSNMTSLLHLDISDTDVTEIPANSFKNKTTLLSVKLPNGLISIGDYAFSGTYLSEELVLPETLETIGKYAFNNCSLMSGTLKFPASIKQIGSYGFYGCSAITEVDLSEATELGTLDSYVFANCNALETVKLNNTLKNIGANTFYNCSSIKMLDLSKCESLASISGSAFSDCSSIEIVNFPSTLTSLGANAFANCTNLLHMSVPCTTPPTIANNADPFSGVDNIACVLSIPTDNFFDYWDANYWGGFVDIENKSDIQIEVTNLEDDTRIISDGCLIKYSKSNLNANMALTAGGHSVFVGNGDAVTFSFTPEDGKEIDMVLFNGEDVTSELVNNTYTTFAVNEKSSLEVILKGTLIGIEEIQANEAAEIEYYNLQGVRVMNPEKGIYIKRQGDKTSKVVL